MNGLNYYRIKMAYRSEADNGALVKTKTEDLVMATCYTEAEKIAYHLMEGKNNFGDVNYEIIKTKISNVIFNETFRIDETLTCGLISYYFEDPEKSEVGLYAVSAVINTQDEKTGKIKAHKERFYIPAASPNLAIKEATKYISDNISLSEGFIVRNVKYDKAQSVMVTPEVHKANIA